MNAEPVLSRDLKMEAHLRAISVWIRIAPILGILFILIFKLGNSGGAGTSPNPSNGSLPTEVSSGILIVFLLIVALAVLAVGHHLWKYSNAARIIVVIFCILGIGTAIRGMAAGGLETLVSLASLLWTAFLLWGLLNARASLICRPEYRDVIAANAGQPVPIFKSVFFWVPILLIPMQYGVPIVARGQGFSEATDTQLRITDFEVDDISFRAPGGIDTNEYDEVTGSRRFALVDKEGTYISITVAPAPSYHPLVPDLQKRNEKEIAEHYKGRYSGLRSEEVRFRFDTSAEGPLVAHLIKPDTILGSPASGAVWYIPESHYVVFSLIASRSRDRSSDTLSGLMNSLRVAKFPTFPIHRPADALKPTIPAGWEMVLEDFRKRYWLREDGAAFILVSKGTPNPLAETLPSYGISPQWSRMAMVTAEKMSGHDPTPTKSHVVFNPHLFVQVSRTEGVVDYGSSKFMVEMDMWYEPRISKTTRIYVGGRTYADLQDAKTIRDSIGFEWRTQ